MKRLYIVIFVMVALIFSITGYAEAELGGSCGSSVTWSLNSENGELKISGEGNMSNYSFAGNDIVRTPWFDYKNEILSVVVEEGVTSIGAFSFYNLRSLGKVTLPDTVVSLGEDSFAYCYALESITLPDEIKHIYSGAFRNCKSLTEIHLPEKLSYIQSFAFYDCKKITQVTFHLPDCVIDNSAFYDCDGFTVVGHKNSTAHTFAQRNGLTFVNIDTGKEIDPAKCGDDIYWSFDSESGILNLSGTGGMYDYNEQEPAPWNDLAKKIEAVVIGEGITYIGSHAFFSLPNLRSVTMPDGVTEIGDHAFSLCISMDTLSLPSSVKHVGEYALAYCYLLKSIELPEGLDSIPSYFLTDCDELTSVEVPSTVTQIGEGAFSNCDNLIAVYFPSSVKSIGENVFRDFGKSGVSIYTTKGSYSENYAKANGNPCIIVGSSLDFEIDVPVYSGVCGENIEWNFNAYSGTLYVYGKGIMNDWYYTDVADDKDIPAPWRHLSDKITSVVIDGEITAIGRCAFFKLDKLKSVQLPYDFETIGDYAFAYCRNLKDIKFRGIKKIGANAFMHCTSLERIKIPVGAKWIMDSAFLCCEGLREILLPRTLEFIGDKAFGLCDSLEIIDIPNGTRYIERSAFASCKKLQVLIISNSVSEIGRGIVNGCDNVTVYTDNGYVKGILENENVTCKPITSRLGLFKGDNAYSGQFKDVKDGDWFAQNVKTAYESGLMLGTSETEFSPTQNITIAQVVTLAARIHSIYYTGKAEFKQSEVWYEVYDDYFENYMYNKYIGSMEYEKRATREEVVEILHSALPKDVFTPINSITEIPDYLHTTGAVIDFYNAGILTGSDEERSFKPDTYITRAEIAAIVTRMINVDLRVKL